MLKKLFIFVLMLITTSLFVLFLSKEFKKSESNQSKVKVDETLTDETKNSLEDEYKAFREELKSNKEFLDKFRANKPESISSLLSLNKKKFSPTELAQLISNYNQTYNKVAVFFDDTLSKIAKQQDKKDLQYYPINQTATSNNTSYFIYGVFSSPDVLLVLTKQTNPQTKDLLLFVHQEDETVVFLLNPKTLKSLSNKCKTLVKDPYNSTQSNIFNDKFSRELSLFPMTIDKEPKSHEFYFIFRQLDGTMFTSMKLEDQKLPDFIKFLSSPISKVNK